LQIEEYFRVPPYAESFAKSEDRQPSSLLYDPPVSRCARKATNASESCQ
jgi:hypothetical protein